MERTKKEVEECLKRERPGLLKREPNIKRAETYLRKAFWNLKAADHNYKGQFYDWTIIISYYAMYFASLAPLLLIGLWGRNHVCAVKALKFFFVEKGKLEEAYVRMFDKAKKLEENYIEKLEEARKRRLKVQYDIIIAKENDAKWTLKIAKDFVRRIERLIEETNK